MYIHVIIVAPEKISTPADIPWRREWRHSANSTPLNEVVAELDRSDFEDSEDDLDGCLDMKSDDEAYTNKRRDGAVEGNEERTEKEDDLIGTNRDRE